MFGCEGCVSLQEALWRMDDSRLSVEQLTALSRAVPEEQERRDLGLFLRVCRVCLCDFPAHLGVAWLRQSCSPRTDRSMVQVCGNLQGAR